ncbi:hypothetical protein BJX68DRAFT_248699, partial [Aspergillus pseudodeflectus]
VDQMGRALLCRLSNSLTLPDLPQQTAFTVKVDERNSCFRAWMSYIIHSCLQALYIFRRKGLYI